MLEIVRKNWKWLLGVILFVWFLISLPLIVVFLFGNKDVSFLGQFFNSDTFVYYQYIRQIIDGGFFIYNQFNPVIDNVGFFNVFWLFSGLLGRVLGFGPVGTFVFLKYLLSPILIITSFYIFNYVFSKDDRKTKLAHAILMFGGGFGYIILILRMFGYAERNMASYYFMDVWATEISPYLSMFETPHFVLSWTFLLLSFYYILRIFSDKKISYAWKGSLFFGLLAQFHPYYIPVIFLFFFVRAAFYFFDKKDVAFIIKRIFVFSFFPLVSISYFLYGYLTNDILRVVALNNITPTPPISNILGSFGFLLIISFLYVIERFRKDLKERSVFLYIILLGMVQLFLLFAPYPQQRRNIEGVNFVFAILVVQALYLIDFSYIKKWSKYVLNIIVVSMFFSCFMFFFYYTLSFIDVVQRYTKNDTQAINLLKEKPPVIIRKEEKSFLNYIKKLDRGVFLANTHISFLIPSYTKHNVFYGHWAETISNEKSELVYKNLYKEKINIDSRISYVVIDTQKNPEDQINTAYHNLKENNFSEINSFGELVIFEKK